tara:strand:+ start:103716 stop:105368 length:1653 start_codon:yes stop_codon:yes gene_type:complete
MMSPFYAQKVKQHEVDTEISKVTVYLSGAEVSRDYTVQLQAGLNELRFTNISANTDSRSIQFEMDDPADLLSITMERDFLKTQNGSTRIQSVRDSIEMLQEKNQGIQDEINALQTEKQVLNTNQKIGGDNVSLTVEQIRSTATFYRERSLAINTSISQKEREKRTVNQSINRLQQQLNEFNFKENSKNNVIVVLVEKSAAGSLKGSLKYNVSNTGWAPSYDLIAPDISGEIELKYKAKVFNNTGNDWKNVEISLSTGDPNLSASVPELSPWKLNYSTVRYARNRGSGKNYNYAVPQQQSRQAPAMEQGLDGQGRIQNIHTGNISGVNNAPEMRTIEVSELSTEFDIERKYSIPSDAKPYIVEITEYDLTGDFSHVSVPKLDKDAFLLAKITGWEKLDLVPGPSNVYFNQTYVGESYINTRNVEDTLGLSFGRDDKILVTRKRVEEFSNKSVIGNSKKDTYAYEIIVKNNRSRDIEMELFDQIPISTDSDIDVSVNETSDATYDESTGELVWKVKLKPGEAKKYTISFTIKYPKEKKIQVKKYRSVSAPSF